MAEEGESPVTLKKPVISGGNGHVQPDPFCCLSTVPKPKRWTQAGLQGGYQGHCGKTTSLHRHITNSLLPRYLREPGSGSRRTKRGQEMLLFLALDILPCVARERHRWRGREGYKVGKAESK